MAIEDRSPVPWIVGISTLQNWPVYRLRDMNNPDDPRERMANLALMQNAPEMYDLLEKIMKECMAHHSLYKEDLLHFTLESEIRTLVRKVESDA